MTVPLRARVSLLRQRIILTLRWWFRLPIDAIKEQNVQTQIDGLLELNRVGAEAMKTMGRVLGQVQARLQWYEKNIPRMRDLRREFEREQEKLRQSANGTSDEAKQRLSDGVVGAIRQ